MRRGTLLNQVLMVNLLLIAAAVVAAYVASAPDNGLRTSRPPATAHDGHRMLSGGPK